MPSLRRAPRQRREQAVVSIACDTKLVACGAWLRTGGARDVANPDAALLLNRLAPLVACRAVTVAALALVWLGSRWRIASTPPRSGGSRTDILGQVPPRVLQLIRVPREVLRQQYLVRLDVRLLRHAQHDRVDAVAKALQESPDGA